MTVRDASPLRRTAPVEVGVPGGHYPGYLEWDPGVGAYRGTVTLPDGVGGRPRLRHLDLEDEVGNSVRYQGG